MTKGRILDALFTQKAKPIHNIENGDIGNLAATTPQIQSQLEAARTAAGFMRRERKLQRCRSTISCIGGISAFVVCFVWIFLCLGPLELIFSNWGLGHTLSIWIRIILFFGFPLLFYISYLWLSEKSGLHYFTKDWGRSWSPRETEQSHNIPKFRHFPWRKRTPLIRNLDKELIALNNELSRIEEEAGIDLDEDDIDDYDNYDNYDGVDLDEDVIDDLDVFDSLKRVTHIIISLNTEVYYSSISLIKRPERASWKGFVLTLENTYNKLKLEEKYFPKYHPKVQPLIKKASQIVGETLSTIINF